MNVIKILFMLLWFPAALAGTCLLIDATIPRAHAQASPCLSTIIDNGLGHRIERFCDYEQGNVCYQSINNGHGINILSCLPMHK